MKIFDNGDKGFFVKCTPDEKAKLIEALKKQYPENAAWAVARDVAWPAMDIDIDESILYPKLQNRRPRAYSGEENEMKYNAEIHKFAVIQDGCTLYGVGATEQAALENAAEWLEINGTQGGGTASDVEKMLADPVNHFHGDLILTTNADEIKQYIESV
jgi:hypothetical protein